MSLTRLRNPLIFRSVFLLLSHYTFSEGSRGGE